MSLLLLFEEIYMDHIKLYEVDAAYVNYLSGYAAHLFHNKQPGQANARKYIGVVLSVNGTDYFAPLSSFKDKHSRMQESVDFLKIKRYAVININNMFPVPKGLATYVNISQEKNDKYRSLLLAEYRAIKPMEEKIRKNAQVVYKHRMEHGDTTSLGRRCNDFLLLEAACNKYRK